MESILIVEDDAAQATALKQFLSSWGYEVTLLASAAKAITYLSTNTPDLAIINLHLEDHPGIEILKHIRDTDAAIPIPVFMVSPEDSPEMRIVCMSTGADDFLPMPLNLADVSMKVQQALERVKHQKEIFALNQKLEKDKRSLRRYFPETLVEKILNEEISTELGGSIIESSIMFFDLRGSTTLAESIGPENYAKTISELFADLMDLIFGIGGSVNELLGDGILATFGCPEPKAEDATNAVQTALSIMQHIEMINGIRSESGQTLFGYGIGIATGRVFAGNIGSARLIKYVVMGDPVNTAARLQELTKKTGYPIIVDENTRKRSAVKTNYERIHIGSLRGKKETIQVYGVGRRNNVMEAESWSV